MRVVVTGATSFIGAATVVRLLRAGHQVYAVVRPASGHLNNLLDRIPETAAERLQVIELDLSDIGMLRNHAAVRAEERAADAWIHIGWDGAGSENRKNRSVQQGNVRHSLAAVRAAAELGCRRFLFTGSQAEYGIRHDLTAEDAPCRPVSEYGKAKADFGRQAAPLCERLGMEYVHARIFSVYGPGDHPWSLVQSCLRTWISVGEMEFGACSQKWNFLYIEDAALALACLLTEGGAGVYNIASNDTRLLREYIGELYELCGCRGGCRYGMRPENAEGPTDLMPDIQKILAETGWRPTTTFSEGIYETLHCLQEQAAG